MREFPNCIHARKTEKESVVECTIGKYGGRPHIGVCGACSYMGKTAGMRGLTVEQQMDPLNPQKTVTAPKNPSPPLPKKQPCLTKVCRRTNEECSDYRSCRDFCQITKKRITEFDKCPKL